MSWPGLSRPSRLGRQSVAILSGVTGTSPVTTSSITAITCLMKVDGKDRRTIWVAPGGQSVGIIDQRTLPHEFVTRELRTLDDAVQAIKTMQVRGAPLIGVTAAYGVWLALRADASDDALTTAYAALFRARPTAINLKCALDDMSAAVRNPPDAQR